MKSSKKIIIIATALVLASALALGGCMHFMSEPPVETEEYNPDEMSLPSVIEETPTAQSEMQKKFGAYGKEEIGENGEKIFHLFTEEQIAESMSLREKGERRSLTYEEIVFIINDSIRMYFEYDKIIITDFVDHVHPEPTGALDYDLKIINKRYDRCEVSSLGYTEILTYHGDYSDKKSYDSALETYSTMIYDIEAIILDRLRIHDTGTEGLCMTSYAYDDDYTRLYGILFDGGELSSRDEYTNILGNSIKSLLVNSVSNDVKAEHPMVYAKDIYDANSGKPSITISYRDGEKETQLFPTEELKALSPDGTLTLSGTTDGLIPTHISFEFDRWTGKVTYTYKNMGYATIMMGAFGIKNDILIMSFTDGKSICLEYVDGKFRIYNDLFDAFYRGEFDEEIVFECSSAYNEDFVFPHAFIHNTYPYPIRVINN
ncbi:MAG: hypothetical protein J6S71_00185 [Clostridia bacterium]|nr:hypothetical protein [Clostridia bacterium]